MQESLQLLANAAAEKKKWKLATTWGSTLTPFIDAPTNMAKLVERCLMEDLQSELMHQIKHKAALGILDMVKGGQYDMGHSASYYWKGKDIDTFHLQQCHLV